MIGGQNTSDSDVGIPDWVCRQRLAKGLSSICQRRAFFFEKDESKKLDNCERWQEQHIGDDKAKLEDLRQRKDKASEEIGALVAQIGGLVLDMKNGREE